MMGTKKMFTAGTLIAVLGSVVPARAGFVQSFTDIDTWPAAASGVGTGVIHEIDFETLPDGSPSFAGAFITDQFNYTEQGVDFFSFDSDLFIAGNPVGGFRLSAGPIDSSSGPRTWIIAQLVTPAAAIGVVFPGNTNISVFDESGSLLGIGQFGSSGANFGGFVSDQAIASLIIDRGVDRESIHSFHFTPVPEPSTVILAGVGVLCFLWRKFL